MYKRQDREDAVLEYAARLRTLQKQVKDKLLLVPRIYSNKPRTTGDGYKGMLHQPDPNGQPDMLKGLIAIRKMHMKVLEQTGFSSADEDVYKRQKQSRRMSATPSAPLTMSRVRIRVDSRLWWASRMVVSVSSSFF